MKKILFYVASIASLVSVSCSSVEKISQRDLNYNSVVNRFSDRAENYSGFINVFSMQATLLNTEVVMAQIEKKSQSLDWDASRKNEELRKAQDSLNSETTVFLSFYSPERKIDDLDKTATVWKVFLDVDGRRYEAKVVKFLGNMSEIQQFFPYHNHFATAYKLVFQVPSIRMERSPSQLTITGPIGSEKIDFKPITGN